MTTLIKRTTLIVRDLGRSIAFYRDGLGLEVWYDDEVVLSGRGLAAGGAGDRTRLVILKAQDPVIGMIGLLQWVDPELPGPTVRRDRLGIGDVVFVLHTDDLEAVMERLRALGTRVHAEPHLFEVRGADGRQLRMRSASVWDPDDYFLEINQRLPSEVP
ncbi:MAG: VOC family protein [Steroidobacteraceae bacterium]